MKVKRIHAGEYRFIYKGVTFEVTRARRVPTGWRRAWRLAHYTSTQLYFWNLFENFAQVKAAIRYGVNHGECKGAL